MRYARASANRTFGLALLASLLAHGLLLLFEWPQLKGVRPVEPDPIVARLVEPPAPPSPAPRIEPPPPRLEKPPPPPRTARPAPAPAKKRPRAADTPRPVSPAKRTPEPSPAPAPSPATPPAPIAAEPLAKATPQPPAAAIPEETLRNDYRAALLEQARRDKRYPPVAIDNAWEGDVVVRLRMGADGEVASLRVTTSSGYAVLDQRALEMFRRASSRVALPAQLRGKAFEIELRAVFRLDRAQASG